MSDPAHYVTSDYYQPGLLDTVASFGVVVLLVLCAFIAAVVGARFVLRRSRRLNPATRKALRLVGGLAKPAAPLAFRRRRQSRLGSRRKTEDHYKMKPALAGVGPAPTAAPTSTRFDSTLPQKVERPGPRKRPAQELSPLPAEAWPFFAEDEIQAVTDVLRSGRVNQWTGSKVIEFEQAYTRLLRNGRAIALANGSVALELALRAFQVGAGDEVIVTPRSFVASAFCVRLVGATPVFAEVDRDSGNITAETISAAITSRTKAIIPVHLGGWPTDMPAIMALAREHGIRVIEDCAQAHGAEIDGLPVGSFGDAAAFSFCQDKIISTGGEGGLVTFRDDEAFEWAWSFKDHGKDRGRALENPSKPGFRWLHDRVGTNWRMTEIAATIGLRQLEKLPQWQARRQRNAESWAEALRSVGGLRVPQPARNITHGYYKFYAYVDVALSENARLRDAILEAATAAGLRAFSGSCSEVYREAAFADIPVEPLPVAKELGESSLMFEVHPTLDTMRLRDRADAIAQIARDIIG
ncbi:DegT/DnrJ/EryC1/StrS aminotransferase family protein [Sphingosinicella sp. CPCC 101087]|uniref:DegT/DnrJ/EryC1/StrS family aminotransferase n=1 Tax=Sphingosinicella sp. CPCC 101087 TaxID=2497754 RepID=UPI001981597C|nr:DegT/DnrJ/EryC1/StrS aminotransferase family protein [Sphingosinicella sp. CPCC 101087]